MINFGFFQCLPYGEHISFAAFRFKFRTEGVKLQNRICQRYVQTGAERQTENPVNSVQKGTARDLGIPYKSGANAVRGGVKIMRGRTPFLYGICENRRTADTNNPFCTGFLLMSWVNLVFW